MTDEANSYAPTADANAKPPSQGPPPSAPSQGEITPNPQNGTNGNQQTARELAREFRWVEITSLVINGALAVIGIVALCIYYGQLGVMRGQLGEIIKQFPEIQKSANAAKSAAETAAGNLKASQEQFRNQQRPLVWVNPGVQIAGNGMSATPLPDLVKQKLALQINVLGVNGGHSPATSYTQTEITVIFDEASVAEKRVAEYKPSYRSSTGDVLMPTSGVYFHTAQPVAITDNLLEDLRTGKKEIFVLGALKYKDIFSPEIPSPYQSQFCFLIHADGLPFGDCGHIGKSFIK